MSSIAYKCINSSDKAAKKLLLASLNLTSTSSQDMYKAKNALRTMKSKMAKKTSCNTL